MIGEIIKPIIADIVQSIVGLDGGIPGVSYWDTPMTSYWTSSMLGYWTIPMDEES